ncbi:mucin-5AC [Diabrotica virgifera virgifera]|uniref:Mucin-5AC n=1 Tax=Diabrotica virgifera virgifera TaxID=50390 RepID=A0A6P7H9C4_DIAVI|nr:mucin-5AC [Diabrotica virgifera virgifera]
MWLLVLLLTGAELIATAEDIDANKDGELSRKILGQSVVTSVSVVMDIGNGTKTIYSDPLGKPMDKPLSSSDVASPIKLLNPDRYEFYTFDDNGNLVRRLMSLEEIKGIIATGDSDGLEYDSGFSEAYIPEKRVNDVLSNVQNVLKEEMEIHSTKLEGFPTLDTPDVSDSWNMILPAVFGNSGADITPEKPPLHVTPDTIMIEPTEKHHSTPRSTPITSPSTIASNKVSGFPPLSSYSTSTTTAASTSTSTVASTSTSTVASTSTSTVSPTSTSPVTFTSASTSPSTSTSTSTYATSTPTSKSTFIPIFPITSTSSASSTSTHKSPSITTYTSHPFVASISTSPTISVASEKPTKEAERTTVLTTESKEVATNLDAISDFSTKEYIPISTITAQKPDRTTGSYQDTQSTYIPVTDKFIKLDTVTSPQPTPSKIHFVKIEPLTSTTELSTTEDDRFITESASSSSTNKNVPEESVTNLQELTIQSVESTINCTSDKNEIDTTTTPPLIDDINAIDKIAAPEILNQLFATPLVHDINSEIMRDTMNQLLNNAPTEISNDTFETTTENISSTDTNESTFSLREGTTVGSTLTTLGEIFTVKIPLLPAEKDNVNTIANDFSETEGTSIIPTTFSVLNNTYMSTKTEKVVTTLPHNISTIETNRKPVIEYLNGAPIKSTKLEASNETITEEENSKEVIKTTTEAELPNLNGTTIIGPITLIDNVNDQNESSIRIPLIEPTQITSLILNTKSTDTPSISIIINESTKGTTTQLVTTSTTARPSTYTTPNDTKSVVLETVSIVPPSSTTLKKPESTTEDKPIATQLNILRTTEQSTIKPLTVTTKSPTTTVHSTSPKVVLGTSKEPETKTNWTLVPTIAPHSGNTFENPLSSVETYPEILEPSQIIDLKAEPFSGFGLEDSTSALERDIYQFSQLYNELAFDFWKTSTNTLSHARSVVVSPFGAISLLAMIFLGARGSTSAEMNELLKLDDMITFNPHLVLKNVGESIVPEEKGSGIVTSAIIREMFSDKGKGKILPFYKERVRAFYDGYVEEVNFSEIGDIIRRRTNLQVKKHSSGRIPEFLTDMSVAGKPPLLGLSVNVFQTDCSITSAEERDSEMHFTVLPSIRQRRLVPIPAALYRSGFLAGYEASLDATAVAIGDKTKTVSTIFVMPGQQGMPAPGDGLARLEKSLVESSVKKGAWSRLLRSLIPRAGLEVQIPKIVHRSVINTTFALSKMGFTELFNKEKADLMGMNGVPNELYLSDIIQLNQFTTCGERRSDHHSEIYPNRSGRNGKLLSFMQMDDHFARDLTSSDFQDPLHDLSYLDLPLPLRPRQARKPELPRLKFDRPFLYFVRHNPTGLILHIGRFNPRLLP